MFKPAHDKNYSKTCVTSKDSDRPVHPPIMARVLVYPSLDSPETVEGACGGRTSLTVGLGVRCVKNLGFS